MEIDHIHFYVEDAKAQRDWFVDYLGFQAIASITHSHTHTELIQSGLVRFALSSPRCMQSPIAKYLDRHPPGVADIAFAVQDLESCLHQATIAGAKVLQPPQEQRGFPYPLKWAKISGWGELNHTLIQQNHPPCQNPRLDQPNWMDPEKLSPPVPLIHPHFKTSYPIRIFGECFGIEDSIENFISYKKNTPSPLNPLNSNFYLNIDHFVLNVEKGDLKSALSWYKKTLGFEGRQTFNIQTNRSGLHSQVMIHPESSVQFPINEPTSGTSQIQEFLALNRGPGIQHIALGTSNIVKTVHQLRRNHVRFIDVPPTYYETLRQRLGFDENSAEWQEIEKQQILADWHPDSPNSLLLQTFTQPIFEQPTFFFEVIERRQQAAGFGKGNFKALFEAIEQEQLKREGQHLQSPL
jgi:4-hydroxyphenylpyruvate dioxygenase